MKFTTELFFLSALVYLVCPREGGLNIFFYSAIAIRAQKCSRACEVNF